MFKILCGSALMVLSSGALCAHDVVQKCMPASFERGKTVVRESFSDDFGDYFEFNGVRYGATPKGEGYVGVGSENVMLTSVHFRDPQGKSIAIRPDDFAISRAVAYGSKSDRMIVCVLSSFSGLGSSGSFQGRAGLIAVRKPHGQEVLRIEGTVVRVRR
jgi:hypothetical protein